MSALLRCSKGKFTNKKLLEGKSKVTKRIAAMNRAKVKIGDKKTVRIAADLLEGRRIVELRELAKNLTCHECQKELHLQDTVGEDIYGLHSVLNVKCTHCRNIIRVPTGKSHITKDESKHFDVNTRAVLGTVHAGAGCSSLNKILAGLNIPVVNADLFKRYEREVGPALQEAAKESCKVAVEEERRLTLENIDKLCQEL